MLFIGPHPLPTVALKDMACKTGGSFTTITAMGAIRTKIQVWNQCSIYKANFQENFFSLKDRHFSLCLIDFLILELVHAYYNFTVRIKWQSSNRLFLNLFKCSGKYMTLVSLNSYLTFTNSSAILMQILGLNETSNYNHLCTHINNFS